MEDNRASDRSAACAVDLTQSNVMAVAQEKQRQFMFTSIFAKV